MKFVKELLEILNNDKDTTIEEKIENSEVELDFIKEDGVVQYKYNDSFDMCNWTKLIGENKIKVLRERKNIDGDWTSSFAEISLKEAVYDSISFLNFFNELELHPSEVFFKNLVERDYCGYSIYMANNRYFIAYKIIPHCYDFSKEKEHIEKYHKPSLTDTDFLELKKKIRESYAEVPKEFSFTMKPNWDLFHEIVKDAELLNEKMERFKDSIEIELQD